MELEDVRKSKLLSHDNRPIYIQNPLSIDGDSVYEKDICTERCTKEGWEGDIAVVFRGLHGLLKNETSDNPKVLFYHFYRTLYLHEIGFGCSEGSLNFSNLKIEFIGSGGTVRYNVDDSSNSEKYTSKLYTFNPTACNAIRFSFYTSDHVGLSNITIPKEIHNVSRPYVPEKFYQSGIVSEILIKQRSGQLVGMILSKIENNAQVKLFDGSVSGGELLWDSGAMENKTIPFHIAFYDLPFEDYLSLSVETASADVLLIYR